MFPWDDLRKMFIERSEMANLPWRSNIAKNFNCLSKVHHRYRQTNKRETTDRRTGDDIRSRSLKSRSISVSRSLSPDSVDCRDVSWNVSVSSWSRENMERYRYRYRSRHGTMYRSRFRPGP